MEIQDIITEFGAYYMNGGQNARRIFVAIMQKSVTENLLTTIMTDDTRWQAAKASLERVLQPFQKAWTPIETAKFEPLVINQHKLKIDSEEYPDDLEASWLGFLADSSLDRKEWPFVRWFIETLLIPKSQEDFELNEVYYGKQKTPTANVAGEAGTSIDGIRHIINSNIQAGRTAPIVLGAIPTDPVDFVNYIEAFEDGISLKYASVPMQIAMAEKYVKRFLRGHEKKYNTYYKNSDASAVKFSNKSIIGLPSMVGSDKIFATTKENAILLRKKSMNERAMRVENVDRKVKMYTDFWKGIGFILPEIIFTNDVDLGVPTISNITPLAAAAAGGTTITVEGRDFTGATSVKLGGTNCTAVNIISDTKLTAVTPAKSAASYTVTVQTAYGTSANSAQSVVVS